MHEECKDLFERISEYIDGEVDQITCEKIEEHFRDCPECKTCFESLKKSVSLCKEMPNEEVPIEAKQRLRASLTALMKQQHP